MNTHLSLLSALRRLLVTAGIWLALSPVPSWACSICYGDPDAPVSKGLSWAILALASLVVLVLGGVIAFFIHMSRRAALLLPAGESATATAPN